MCRKASWLHSYGGRNKVRTFISKHPIDETVNSYLNTLKFWETINNQVTHIPKRVISHNEWFETCESRQVQAGEIIFIKAIALHNDRLSVIIQSSQIIHRMHIRSQHRGNDVRVPFQLANVYSLDLDWKNTDEVYIIIVAECTLWENNRCERRQAYSSWERKTTTIKNDVTRIHQGRGMLTNIRDTC